MNANFDWASQPALDVFDWFILVNFERTYEIYSNAICGK